MKKYSIWFEWKNDTNQFKEYEFINISINILKCEIYLTDLIWVNLINNFEKTLVHRNLKI